MDIESKKPGKKTKKASKQAQKPEKKLNYFEQSHKDRQDMQQQIKNLEQRQKNIETLLGKGGDCIVFQLGSHTIKYGLANESKPHVMRNVIAYKCGRVVPKEVFGDEFISGSEGRGKFFKYIGKMSQKLYKHKNIYHDTEATMTSKQTIKVNEVLSKNKVDDCITIDDTSKKTPSPMEEEKEPQPTQEQPQTRKYIFGEEALKYEDTAHWNVRHPIKFGFFNISNYYSLRTIKNDLQTIFLHLITKKLKISQSDLRKYYVVLAIPDFIQKKQILALMDIFLRKLHFRAIYLHKESVLAAFGAGLNLCCVVDIGSDKLSVCCIEDGTIIRNSLFRKNFGSRDLDYVYKLLCQKRRLVQFLSGQETQKEKDFQTTVQMDQLAKVKEIGMGMRKVEENSNIVFKCVAELNEKEFQFQVQLDNSLYITPHCLFNDQIFNLFQRETKFKDQPQFDYNSSYFKNIRDHGDYIQGLFHDHRQEIHLIGSEQLKESLDYQFKRPFLMKKLDELICYSISKVKYPEKRKKLANSIIICGGGCQIKGLIEELEDHLIDKIQRYDPSIERTEIVHTKRHIDPINISWVGATIIPKVEIMKEYWIKRDKYLAKITKKRPEFKTKKPKHMMLSGVIYLKKKIPFKWE